MTAIFYKEENYKIVGACMKVHSALGPGFPEAVYQEALEKEFTAQGIPFVRQKKLPVLYNGEKLKKYYVADFLCYDHIVVEIKAQDFLSKTNFNQLKNSLKAINLKLGILVNFGFPSLTYKRMINASCNSMKLDEIGVAPQEEQNICVSCGFCCDGTLFLHAHLNPGERGNLPAKIEKASLSEDGKDYFRLPCRYFSERCTIYDRKRADICASYRCQLLKDHAAGKIIQDAAIEAVREAREMHGAIMAEYQRLSGRRKKINFRQLLSELGKMQKNTTQDKPVSKEYEMLLARCNIFEALLIKRFRSAEDFEKLVMR
jgi:GxxExxY protein